MTKYTQKPAVKPGAMILEELKENEEKRETLKNINLSNKREFKEEYAAYRKRLRENYYKVTYYLKGQLFWDSLSKGTYRR